MRDCVVDDSQMFLNFISWMELKVY